MAGYGLDRGSRRGARFHSGPSPAAQPELAGTRVRDIGSRALPPETTTSKVVRQSAKGTKRSTRMRSGPVRSGPAPHRLEVAGRRSVAGRAPRPPKPLGDRCWSRRSFPPPPTSSVGEVGRRAESGEGDGRARSSELRPPASPCGGPKSGSTDADPDVADSGSPARSTRLPATRAGPAPTRAGPARCRFRKPDPPIPPTLK